MLSLCILAAGLIVACDESGQNKGDQEEEYLPDSVNTDGMATVSPEYLIESVGLSFADLGQMLEEMDTIVPGMGILQDTLSTESGYKYATRTLHVEDGTVVVEGEYVREEDASQERIAQSFVNRIRIQSPSFQTKYGVATGMTIEALNEKFPGELFLINPIPAYQAIDITGAFDTHIHYLIHDPGNAIGLKAMEENVELTLDDLPKDKKLFAIVLMR